MGDMARPGSTEAARGEWLLTAGVEARRVVKARFHGNADMAAVQARKLIEHPAILEAWGSERLDSEAGVRHWGPFRFSDFPAGLRETAMQALAVAYLAAGEPLADEVISGPVTYMSPTIDEEVEVEFG